MEFANIYLKSADVTLPGQPGASKLIPLNKHLAPIQFPTGKIYKFLCESEKDMRDPKNLNEIFFVKIFRNSRNSLTIKKNVKTLRRADTQKICKLDLT